MLLITIFCEVDDFCKQFEKNNQKISLTDGNHLRRRAFKLQPSEIMTITIWYHCSGYKTFKDYYEKYVLMYLKNDFPKLVSYSRFIELRKNIMVPLAALCQSRTNATKCSGYSFIDSFPLKVSHNKRIYSHKTFKGIAKRGKTSVGWFYGFKLHAIINLAGEIISFFITPGNVADNNATVLDKLLSNLFGKLYGDKGYIVRQEIFEKIYSKGVQLVTKLKKKMKNKLMLLEDKLLLKKRGLIESVGAVLKEDLSLEHSRHRSISGFFSHVFSTLAAYSFREKKPKITLASELITMFA